MSEKKLFGTPAQRAQFEEKARSRHSVAATTTDALIPVVIALIVTPSLIGTTFL